MNQTQHMNSHEPALLAPLHMVAKIALSVGAIAGIAFGVMVFVLGGGVGGDSYQEVFNSLRLAGKHLQTILWISGTILVTVTGITTWLIALYSTYRVAGPLHRFTQTLEKQIDEGPQSLGSLHASELLQNEHMRLAGATSRLQYHYDSMSELVELALQQLTLPQANMGGGLEQTLDKLKGLESLVKT